MSNKLNEDTRVKLPALVHLCRLGYTYRAKSNLTLSEKSNIETNVFLRKLESLNPDRPASEYRQVLDKIESVLGNNDLGREFCGMLTTAVSGIKLIDFANPGNNDFFCATELTCEDRDTGEAFRPDITLFVNGLPLAIIEVKKPNNTDGIQAEQNRMIVRNGKETFRRFLNLAQVMVFSNNQEYELIRGEPFLGAYYSTRSDKGKRPIFNCFHEPTFGNSPEKSDFIRDFPYGEVSSETEKEILADNNCQVILNDLEYATNKETITPTNRILTSLCSKERFVWLLKYAFAYVDVEKELADGQRYHELQKHIMRYQQMFATFGVEKRLESGKKSGIIWHTQGSGKTALAYYNVRHLTDYYAKKNVVPKFYFIVDRIALLEQATIEFQQRGLVVHTVNSKDELLAHFRENTAASGATGQLEITVVNIQKFKADEVPKAALEYATTLQRVYFIDEAHRGYSFDGSFLCNLLNSDRNAVKIALTGTPLIGEEKNTCRVFGDYIDTYYYNQSIRDGYTLKLMREDVESNYKLKLREILEQIELEKKKIPRVKIIESEKYCSALLDYICSDLKKCRLHFCEKIGIPDDTVAGMIVCETNPQARKVFELLCAGKEKYGLHSALILHDEDDPQTRKGTINCFKTEPSIDLLVVNNMLLTGFDAPRLKKLYLGRKLKDHGLLQALTRVNRRYKNFEYGYIVDFADIKANFDKTNAEYLAELKKEVGADHIAGISDLFESEDVVIERMKDIREVLFSYETENLEVFQQQIGRIEDKEELLKIKRALESAKSLANVVGTYGDAELKERFAQVSFEKVNKLYGEICRRIEAKNIMDSADSDAEVMGLISAAMSTIDFSFFKKGEEELRMVTNDFRDKCAEVQEEFRLNFDHEAQDYITLKEHFVQYFTRKGWVPKDVRSAKEKIDYLDGVMKQIRDINRKNDLLREKYNRDEKFARIHKRVWEQTVSRNRAVISARETKICLVLSALKLKIDGQIYLREGILRNDPYFEQTVRILITQGFEELKIDAEQDDRRLVAHLIAREYLQQYHNQFAA